MSADHAVVSVAPTGYVVAAPVAVVKLGGQLLTLHQGSLLPDGVDAAHLEHLLEVGLVTVTAAVAPAAAEAAAVAPPAGDPAPAAGAERPLQTAPKAAWVAYAVSQGWEVAEAEARTRAELVAELGG